MGQAFKHMRGHTYSNQHRVSKNFEVIVSELRYIPGLGEARLQASSGFCNKVPLLDSNPHTLFPGRTAEGTHEPRFTQAWMK